MYPLPINSRKTEISYSDSYTKLLLEFSWLCQIMANNINNQQTKLVRNLSKMMPQNIQNSMKINILNILNNVNNPPQKGFIFYHPENLSQPRKNLPINLEKKLVKSNSALKQLNVKGTWLPPSIMPIDIFDWFIMELINRTQGSYSCQMKHWPYSWGIS